MILSACHPKAVLQAACAGAHPFQASRPKLMRHPLSPRRLATLSTTAGHYGCDTQSKLAGGQPFKAGRSGRVTQTKDEMDALPLFNADRGH